MTHYLAHKADVNTLLCRDNSSSAKPMSFLQEIAWPASPYKLPLLWAEILALTLLRLMPQAFLGIKVLKSPALFSTKVGFIQK